MMKKKTAAILGMAVLASALMLGCGKREEDVKTDPETLTEAEAQSEEAGEAELEDGIYSAEFQTDSSMFHVNEACDGKGTLTVKDGQMTNHI